MDKGTLTPNQIIHSLGGTARVARLCEVTESAVSQWRVDGIPKARLMFLRLAEPKTFKQLEAGMQAQTPETNK